MGYGACEDLALGAQRDETPKRVVIADPRVAALPLPLKLTGNLRE